MNKGKFIALSLAVMLMSSAAVYADHHGGKGEKGEKMMNRMFEEGDKNGDGILSKEEFVSGAEERFTKIDADGDGQVTKEEAKAHHEKMRDKWKDKREERASEAKDDAPKEE